MKVLFLPDYSAANAYQRELSAALARRGVDVAADPTRRRRVLPVLEAVSRHGRPDIIHLHWTEPYIASRGEVNRVKAARMLLELRLMRRAGTPLVWTAHDLFRHDRPEDPRELAFMRGLYDLSRAVIVHCRAAGDGLLETLHLSPAEGGRIRVIPHGHYADAYSMDITPEVARRRLGYLPDHRVIAFVGWVRPYKGVAELIDAFARLDDPRARLVVAGKALDEEYAVRLGEAAARDPRVRLDLGFVPDEELQVYLMAADVVATPFLEIFTSGSVLLAMSFGRAVIAPRRGCVSESLDEKGGLLYDASDPQGLLEALVRAMETDLAAMGRHNRSRLPEFDWDKVADATLRAYQEARSERHITGAG